MKKTLSVFITVFLMAVLLIMNTSKTYANESNINTLQPLAVCPFSAGTNAMGTVAYAEYSPSSTRLFHTVEHAGRLVNTSNATITDSFSTLRSVSTEFTSGGNVECNSVAVKIGYKAEVAIGVSTQWSRTVSVTAPPKTTVYYEFGSEFVNTRGILTTWDLACNSQSKTVSSTYSFKAYGSAWQ